MVRLYCQTLIIPQATYINYFNKSTSLTVRVFLCDTETFISSSLATFCPAV